MYWAGRDRPAAGVGLRSGNGVEYHLVDEETEREVGTVDDARVFSAAHPGALYLHQGQQYRVTRLDQVDHVAWLEVVRLATSTRNRASTPTSRSSRSTSATRSGPAPCTSARSR